VIVLWSIFDISNLFYIIISSCVAKG